MRELAVAKRQVCDEKGKVHNYEYSILVGETPVMSGVCCESYGVKITEQRGECSQINDLTTSVSRIDELMDLLVRNTVTPCTLRNVVDDWL